MRTTLIAAMLILDLGAASAEPKTLRESIGQRVRVMTQKVVQAAGRGDLGSKLGISDARLLASPAYRLGLGQRTRMQVGKQGKVEASGGSFFITATEPAEAVVTSVVNDRPRFAVSVSVSARDLAARAGDKTLSAHDLEHVRSVELVNPVDGSKALAVRRNGDTLTLRASGLTEPQQLNMTAFRIHLANGRTVTVLASGKAFHTNTTEWTRQGMRDQASSALEEAKTFSAASVNDARLAKLPPMAAADAPRLDEATARLASLRPQLAARTATLLASFVNDRDATNLAVAASMSDSSPVVKAAGQRLGAALNAVVGAQAKLGDVENVSQAMHATLAAGTPALAEADRAVAQQRQVLASVQTERDAARALLVGQARAPSAPRELLENYEVVSGVTSGPSLRELHGSAAAAQFEIDGLTKQVAEEARDAANVGPAAQARSDRERATAASAMARAAQLRAGVRSVPTTMVTLDSNGAQIGDGTR